MKKFPLTVKFHKYSNAFSFQLVHAVQKVYGIV